MLTRMVCGALLLLTLSTAALAGAQGQSRREQQLAACAGDMERLCDHRLSASKQLKTCIRPNRAKVSRTCRAWLDMPS
ncbi:hypothetical protein [Lichenihabitans psoromatis]|uniref:hypothetical protein n=1 Tax=Lichenihabitans psoromatis TaxID=2528642 RepID=UPI001035B747|nr:hypothetical protein [Lichenihabitans psoromatis]